MCSTGGGGIAKHGERCGPRPQKARLNWFPKVQTLQPHRVLASEQATRTETGLDPLNTNNSKPQSLEGPIPRRWVKRHPLTCPQPPHLSQLSTATGGTVHGKVSAGGREDPRASSPAPGHSSTHPTAGVRQEAGSRGSGLFSAEVSLNSRRPSCPSPTETCHGPGNTRSPPGAGGR